MGGAEKVAEEIFTTCCGRQPAFDHRCSQSPVSRLTASNIKTSWMQYLPPSGIHAGRSLFSFHYFLFYPLPSSQLTSRLRLDRQQLFRTQKEFRKRKDAIHVAIVTRQCAGAGVRRLQRARWFQSAVSPALAAVAVAIEALGSSAARRPDYFIATRRRSPNAL